MNRLTQAVSQKRSPSLCIRTDSEGAIPLPASTPRIFAKAAQRFDHLYLQTKHRFARITAVLRPPELQWIDEGALAASSDQRFIYRPQKDSRRLARIQHCSCCNSPGRIEFRNHLGEELIQLCCPSTVAAYEWGSYVQNLSDPNDSSVPPCLLNAFPVTPSNTIPLPIHPDMLATILSYLSDQGCSIEATLANEESINRRTIRLDAVGIEDQVLTACSPTASVQLDTSAVHRLSFARTANGIPQLYASGEGNSQLLLVEPSNNESDTVVLTKLLNQLVPELM